MKQGFTSFLLLSFLLLAVAIPAGITANRLERSLPGSPSAPGAFTDPFAYCASVGTIDQPDARYAGPKISQQIIDGFIKAAGLEASTAPSDVFEKATIWRCMDGKVYACNFGANLPCASKANTSKAATQEMIDFCKETADADFIPMYITGHESIYSWHCVKDVPEILEQVDQEDAAGYLQRIWYAVAP